jgi:glycine betaine/proline transport system ATP-binding protein
MGHSDDDKSDRASMAALSSTRLPNSPGLPIIRVESLWKIFGDRSERVLTPEYGHKKKSEIFEELGCVVALQDVSFEVTAGETFVVMGLSGCGKSTLVRCLIRLIEPTAGGIWMGEDDILKYDQPELIQLRRNKTAMVFQHFGLLPHKSVLDNAAWGLELKGINKKERCERAAELLSTVGLKGWENSFTGELSGGMQQRVGLARALASDPEILLMDEPFSALDPLIRRDMQDELVQIQQDLNKTIVFITHDLDEALKLGDRIAIMWEGRIVQIGPPETIILDPEDDYVTEFTRDVRRESVLTVSHIMVDPPTVVPSRAGPQEALQTMHNNESDLAFVLDDADIYLGILTIDQAHAAIQAGVSTLDHNVEQFLYTEVPPISNTSVLDKVIPIFMTCDYPIPVVDDGGKLIGAVHRNAVAKAISKK